MGGGGICNIAMHDLISESAEWLYYFNEAKSFIIGIYFC